MSRYHKFQEIADLPERAFQRVGRKMTLEGGGGGETTSTSYQSNLPEYAKPYFEDIMGRGQKASLTPYQQYGGTRVAGFSPTQQAAQQMTTAAAGGGTPQGVQAGQAASLDAANRLGGYNYNPYTTASQQIGPQLDASNAATVGQFMSPYMQNVVDTEKVAAAREYQIAQQARNKQAATAGAFGGSRQAVMDAEAQRALMSQLQGIQSKGSQEAFGQAQQAMQAQRASALEQARANQQADLEAQRQTEASRQFGASSGLQALQQLGTQAGQLADIGQTEQKLAFERAKELSGVGREQQAQQQAQLDQAYQEFAAQRDYEQNMLNWYNNILRGTPVSMDQTVYSTAPKPSTGSQLAGAGIAGLSLYNQMKG